MNVKTQVSKQATGLLSCVVFALLSVFLLNCQSKNEKSNAMKPTITKESFGTLADGQQADLYTLTNADSMVVQITNYGGIITKWMAPDKSGEMADVVLGFDSLSAYVKNNPFFGALEKPTRW